MSSLALVVPIADLDRQPGHKLIIAQWLTSDAEAVRWDTDGRVEWRASYLALRHLRRDRGLFRRSGPHALSADRIEREPPIALVRALERTMQRQGEQPITPKEIVDRMKKPKP